MCSGSKAENPGGIQGKMQSLDTWSKGKGKNKRDEVGEVTGPDCVGPYKPLVFVNREVRIYWMILNKGLT